MKKRMVLAGLLVFSITIAGAAALAGRRPFRDLRASDIVSAEVHLAPPDKTISITEIPELVSYLNEAVVYNQDDSYHDYCGQGVIFSLTMSDGSQKEIMAYNPFLVIDGVGYRTKYEPCEKLNHYANQLLSEAMQT